MRITQSLEKEFQEQLLSERVQRIFRVNAPTIFCITL